jgi:acyl-CoA thioesterase
MLTQDVSGARYRRILSDTEMQMSIESLDTAIARDKALGTHPFDRATTIRRGADGLGAAITSDDYWAFIGPFGGITAATMLRAIVDHPDRAGDPLTLTVNLCTPVARGDYRLLTRLVRATRSTQHWIVELTQPDGGIAAIATAVFAMRRESFAHQPAARPKAPAFEATPVYRFSEPTPAWISQYEFRFVSGAPGFDTGAVTLNSAASLVWMRDHQPRRLDALSLTAMSDAFFGRIFQALGRVVPFGTVSMTTYFHADSEDLLAEDTTMVLGAADGRSFSKNYGDQVGELWSASGRLLATTTQMAYYKA